MAEAAAQFLGAQKSALVGPEGKDPAVRLALAETHVVAATKQALRQAGVAVDLLEQMAAGAGRQAGAGVGEAGGLARSKTALLVKNLPFAVSEEELAALFGPFGTIARLVLPETHTLALVRGAGWLAGRWARFLAGKQEGTL